VAARKAASNKTYIAYQVAGVGKHASAPIPFYVTASSFTAAKERVISEWAVAVSKHPHGFISSFFIRPGDIGDAHATEVAEHFGGQKRGDRYVATVDRKRVIHTRGSRQSGALKKGMTFIGYMSMPDEGHRAGHLWSATINRVGLVEHRSWRDALRCLVRPPPEGAEKPVSIRSP
jgi:hypothetical protein